MDLSIDRLLIINKLGVAGLFSFLMFAWLGTAGAYAGLLAMVVAFIAIVPRNWSTLKQDRLFILTLVVATYLFLRTIWSVIEYPALMGAHINAWGEWLFLGLFVPLAWWMRRCKIGYGAMLLVLFIGFLLSVVKLTDWQTCDVAMGGRRCGFGFQPILSALLLGISLLGLLVFAPRFVGGRYFHWFWFLRAMVWAALVITVSYFIVLTQTRTVWLGLLLVIPIVLLWRYKDGFLTVLRNKRKTGFVLIALFVSVVVSVPVMNEAVLQKHVDRAVNDGMNAFEQWNSESVMDGSLGLRASMFKEGYSMWLERPWFGWGVAGINSDAFLDTVNEKSGYMTHLHNTYLEILVRFGVVGGVLLLSIVVCLVYGMYLRYRDGEVSKDIYIFCYGALALLFFWCIADFQLASTDWRFLFVILMGLAYSLAIRQSTERQGTDASHAKQSEC